jgi:ligand-binding sensor domain-containing protein
VFIGLIAGAQIGTPQVGIRIPDRDIDVQSISSINQDIWFATTKGAYRLTNNEVTRIPDEDLVVNKAVAVGNAVWIATTNGAYKITQGVARRIPDKVLDVITLAAISSSRICLGTATGAYITDGDRIQAIGPSDAAVHRIEVFDNEIWLATARGAYRVDKRDQVTRIPADTGVVNSIAKINGTIWIAAERGAFHLNGNVIDAYLTEQDVARVTDIDGSIWLSASSGAYRIKDREIQRIPDVEMRVESVVGIDGTVWVASNRGAYTIESDQIGLKVPERDFSISTIEKAGDNLWLTSPHGAFVYRNGRLKRVPDIDVNVEGLFLINGIVWMATSLGSYRVDDLSLSVSFEPNSAPFKGLLDWLKPANAVTAGDFSVKPFYLRSDGTRDTGPELSRPDFRVIVETSDEALDRERSGNEYSPASSFIKNISSGKHELLIGVIDKWGNTTTKQLTLWVFPGPAIWAIVLSIIWMGLLAASIAVVPSSEFVNDLLMNPWVRALSSFGLIPLALTTIPWVRKQMLKRYITALGSDSYFSDWYVRYEVPTPDYQPLEFGRHLADDRVVQITGRSGIGKTAYLRFLTACYVRALCASGQGVSANSVARASKHKESPPPPNNIPVFVPIVRYRGQKTEDMIAAQLSSYGRLTDKQLALWYVQQGGFVILLDGLNEIDETTRSDVARFMDENRRRNYCCVSSQEAYPAFAWVKEARLPYLNRDIIDKLLRAHLGEDLAVLITLQFNEETYRLYKLPQDLEFLVQLVSGKSDRQVPQSKSELYDGILAPVFMIWNEAGRSDFREVLVKRAYEMVVTRDPVFNQQGGQVMLEFSRPLLDRKIFVARDGVFYFQHNLVRDYLGSLWLRSRWGELLADGTTVIDENWVEMSKGVLEDISEPAVCREFIDVIMRKNREIAGELFNWLQSSRPSLVDGWAMSFKIKFADSVINKN